MKRLFSASFACLLMFVLASCSIGYSSKWTKAAADTKSKRPTDLTGAWEGTWKSESDGHTGKLRAIVTKSPASPAVEHGHATSYSFLYEATWKKVLSAVISAEHQAKWRGNSCTLTGEKDLGALALGTTFRFTGTATPTEFHAKYDSHLDHGVFEMKRP